VHVLIGVGLGFYLLVGVHQDDCSQPIRRKITYRQKWSNPAVKGTGSG
jgi:hypothetical protein